MGKSSKLKQRKAEADEAAFKQRFSELSRAAAYKAPAAPLADDFAAYSSHFIRSPDDFELRTRSSDRGKQALEMARHLFGRFRVPRILEQVWSAYLAPANAVRELPMRARYQNNARPAAPDVSNQNLRTYDFRAWFVCVATGGSLYKSHTRDLLTKKETHAFLCAPASLDLCQAVIYAVARCANAAEGDALRLARSKISTRRFGAFWFDCVRFFCLPDQMPATINQVNDLLDYLESRHREDANFRLLGSSQSLSAIMRRMEQWHRALARAQDLSGITWPGVDLPDHEISLKDTEHKQEGLFVVWKFRQITTGKDLAAEGTAMRHCVFSYKQSCVSGRCSIWSLTRTDVFGSTSRRLTIELNRNGQIAQKRGLANRGPRPDENHVVELWCRAMGLTNRPDAGW